MYEQLVTALAEMGGKATNKALQEKLGWDKADYLNARSAMLQASHIRLARGRGGSVMLYDYQAKVEEENAKTTPRVSRGVVNYEYKKENVEGSF